MKQLLFPTQLLVNNESIVDEETILDKTEVRPPDPLSDFAPVCPSTRPSARQCDHATSPFIIRHVPRS